MAGVDTPLTERTSLHVAVAFIAMGAWAFYANRTHPTGDALRAAVVQGSISAAITYQMKRALDALRAKLRRGLGWWVPPLITLTVSLSVLVTLHWIFGTPEVLRTIAVPFSVATLYALSYNTAMWKKGPTR